MRNHFDEQLNILNNELITMGARCEEAIASAVKLLTENSPEIKENAIQTDKQIDRKEKEIETLCMRLLLQQQPARANCTGGCLFIWLACTRLFPRLIFGHSFRSI